MNDGSPVRTRARCVRNRAGSKSETSKCEKGLDPALRRAYCSGFVIASGSPIGKIRPNARGTCRAILPVDHYVRPRCGLTLMLTFPNTPSPPTDPNFQQFNMITLTKISD